MRFALIALVTLAVAAAAGLTAQATPGRTVPCGDSIDTTRFPYLGSSQPTERYRLVLGAVSVPPAYLRQVVATNERPWRYRRKAGIVVRGDGGPVTISVPGRWRARAAITWGNSGGPTAALRIAGWPGSSRIGNAYAGGFYLRSPTACLPLAFTVDGRSATVRFGIGRRCS
jgi:hypothetical protein